MQPLDEGQQRELDYLRAQRPGWVAVDSLGRRLLIALCTAVVFGAVVAAAVAVAGGPWLWLGLAAVGFMLLVLVFPVVAPDRALEWHVRSNFPTADAMKRGDRNKSWPG